MAMASQFLGFMLDAYDMAMVLVDGAHIGESIRLAQRQCGVAVHHHRVYLRDHHGGQTCRVSAIFGHYADKIGRRFLLVFTIGGVGAMSLIAGFLPTYAQLGVWSYVIFCVLRFP